MGQSILVAAVTAVLFAGPLFAAAEEPSYVFLSHSRIVAEYPYKLAIFERPAGVTIAHPRPHKLRPGEKVRRSPNQVLMKDGKELSFSSLKRIKELTFKELIFPIYYSVEGDSPKALLVCSNLLADPNDQCTKVHHNPSGAIDQFCGVVSMDGDIIYKFPIVQHLPNRLVSPLLITKDGKKAAIAIGKAVHDNADCGYESVSDLSEVWIWEGADKLTKLKGKALPSTDWKELRRLLATGQL